MHILLFMQPHVRVHLTAAGLMALLVAVIALFWSYPKLLVYVLLAFVAVLAYGALYLILAAWMDPERSVPTTTQPAPGVKKAKASRRKVRAAGNDEPTVPSVAPESAPRSTTKKKRTRKVKRRTSKAKVKT